jgi:hypothetical protein
MSVFPLIHHKFLNNFEMENLFFFTTMAAMYHFCSESTPNTSFPVEINLKCLLLVEIGAKIPPSMVYMIAKNASFII